jgi:hypothetical protein
LIGSAGHAPTGHAMRRFLDKVKEHGLPAEMQIIVCGKGTENLVPADMQIPGVDIRGKVNQDELDTLMLRASAVLLPQESGFGAVTRLPEMSCAGIPVIASKHPIKAINVPPGICAVGEDWNEWSEGMMGIYKHALGSPQQSLRVYQAWEREQPTPLATTVSQFLN